MEQPESARGAADRLAEAVRSFECLAEACGPEALRAREVSDSVRAALVLVDAAELTLNDPDSNPADLAAVVRDAARAVRQSRERLIDVVVGAAAVPDDPGAIG
ncbi:hypothetical protein GCM10010441_45320 [Kitasatospora paracochleata]|uniref:Uncharacterized protein n=1 Tax=Kitasatospora paracochleata TaxID=58354 RepID=A0ABT1J9H2_9ACTN|nr:hypothetical protein [Kitasatospora paracochleata]MCP2314110.1 hypothetical protein [Kitasatospora paracochleata]